MLQFSLRNLKLTELVLSTDSTEDSNTIGESRPLVTDPIIYLSDHGTGPL